MLKRMNQSMCVSAIVTLGASLLVTQFVAAQSNPKESATNKVTRNVAIVVHQDVELLDFAGPGEVFAAAAHRGAVLGQPWFNVYTVAPTDETIVSQDFLTITPEYTIDNCPKPDILVIPGGNTGVLTDDEKFMAWVKETTVDREITLTVCTGALVLAMNDLLDGLDATTHRSAMSELKRLAPKARVHEDARFKDNGSIITTAGVSAGIDGALHVVARLLGRINAEQTAHYMEYDWKPDPTYYSQYGALNPQLDDRGRKVQQADIFSNEQDWDQAAELYQELTKSDPTDGRSWYRLGLALHMAGKFDRAIDVHKKAAEFEGHTQNALYNLACAYALQGKTDEALNAFERAIDAGFDGFRWAMNDSDLESIHNHPRFKALLEQRKAE